MNLENIGTIIGIIVGVGIIIGGIFYLIGSLKKENDDASKSSNEILRGLINDQKEEILRMRERQHTMTNEMQVVKLQVQHLQDKREYLERLVNIALQQYFSTDPEIVQAVKKSLSQQEEK